MGAHGLSHGARGLREALDDLERGNLAPFEALLDESVRWDGWTTGHLWWRRTPT